MQSTCGRTRPRRQCSGLLAGVDDSWTRWLYLCNLAEGLGHFRTTVAYEEPLDYTGMFTGGHLCPSCRDILYNGEETVGVAGLLDDDPEHIALIPGNS